MNNGLTVVRRMRPLLGTYVEIGVQAQPTKTELAQQAIEASFKIIEQLQASLSFHDPHSELSRLNANPGRSMPMSSLALRVLRLARSLTHESDGLFNCTLGGALVQRGRLPHHGETPALLVGDASDIEIDARAARLRRPVLITLDGIAKGFAVDCAVAVLKRYSLSAAWVNAGGDVRVFGECTLPIMNRGQPELTLGLRNAALASSSSRTFYDLDLPGEILAAAQNLRQAHGYWSVLARFAWRADALTKVAALAAPAQRQQLLQRLGGRLICASEVLAA